MKKRLFVPLIVAISGAVLFGSSYNGLVKKQEQVAKSFGQVQAVYQRRLDLIPNLVATVKGYAAHEKQTFIAVAKARSSATKSLSASAMSSPKQFQALASSQQALTSALGKLMVVVERYPELKANENFMTLQSQLEGSENRIAVARERYNNAVQIYDISIRQFPTNILVKFVSGFGPKSYFKASAGADKAPKVSF
jgi:LemA protein